MRVPTHNRGHTLDLVITKGLNLFSLDVKEEPPSRSFLTSIIYRCSICTPRLWRLWPCHQLWVQSLIAESHMPQVLLHLGKLKCEQAETTMAEICKY